MSFLKVNVMPYELVHSASSVAGLQSMLAAGLDVDRLRASAIGDGLVRQGAKCPLPALPETVFSLPPPRPGERDMVA
ncbi:hypothetical protein PWP93_35570 [Paraburkholderia sp. A1RI-2L]